MSVDINLNSDFNSNSIPMMQQSAPIVPTGAQNKLLANFIFVEDTVTGAPSAIFVISKEPRPSNDGNVAISGQLQEIKDKLGLNLSQLSKILDVSRPQLYKWLEGKVVPQREGSNQKISDIYSLLDLIPSEHGRYFGKLANRYVSDERTVFDILSDPELDGDKLLSAYRLIKNDIEAIDNRKAKEHKKVRTAYASEVILPPK